MGEEVRFSAEFVEYGPNTKRISIYDQQIEELAEIRNPALSDELLAGKLAGLSLQVAPIYAYFPWKDTVVEMLPETEFIELKTNRNQQLITTDEQQTLLGAGISIAGMSVGSSLLYGLVGTGIARNIVIADDDKFSTSNLNRVQATVLDINESKALVAARRALEMNPFLKLTVLNQRLDADNIGIFIPAGQNRIIFEEIDDFKMKIRIREEAKRAGVPVIMLTNLGDSVLIDVERYDTNPETALFNGNVSEALIQKIRHETVDQNMMKELAVALVDPSMVSERALRSLQEIGKTLTGRPQLYSTVALDGGIAPYLVKELILGSNLPSGRYALKLSSILGS